MLRKALVAFGPRESPSLGRTLRGLAAASLDVVVVPIDRLADAIRRQDGPIWIVRAGTWPARDGPIRDPLPSATGKPLVATGAVLDSAVVPSAASLYLDPEPAATLARLCDQGRPLDDAVAEIHRDPRWRRVRFAPLDVHFDGGMRILQVVTSLQRGGAERVTLDLAAELNHRGIATQVVTLGRPGRTAFMAPEGTIDLAGLGGDREARAAELDRIARQTGADLVHAHLLDGEDCRRIARQGLPLVVTVHNQRPGWPSGLEQLDAGDATLLVACAQAVAGELTRAGLTVPIRTAWNGIDPAPYREARSRIPSRGLRDSLGWADTDFVMAVVANPRPQKRQDRLPAILAAVNAELASRGSTRRARLVIAGETTARNPETAAIVADVRSAADQLGLTPQIHWAGAVEDVAGLLGGCDLLLSTSDHEGLSLAQLEALAAGVPVVATTAGGVGEIAPGSPSVAVLPIGADARAFGRVIADSVMEPVPAALPASFTKAAMADRYAWLYRRAIARARPTRSGEGVWLVTNNFSIGGAQTSARRLLTGLAARGVRARAAVLQEDADNPTPGRRALLARGIPVLALPPAGRVDAAVAVDELLGEIDADPPSAVLFWNVIPSYRILLADALLGAPIFDVSPGAMSFDSLDEYFGRPRAGLPYRNGRDYGARLAGAIVKYGAEADRAAAILGAPVHVIPNGVPIDPGPRRPRGDRLILGTSARIHPHKRLDRLIKALQLAHANMPPYEVRIAGGIERGCDDHADELRRLAADLPVRWLGPIEPIDDFLLDLDGFVLVAEPAGCPNASLEAMARGLAVIATDVGGMGEQVADGLTGRLVGRDDVAGLAAALVEAATHPDRLEAWGDAGRRRAAERFGLDRMIDDYLRVCLPPPAPGDAA